MPRQDKTGPSGQGSMTGRGVGMCNDSNAQSIGNRRGRGRGMGRNSNIGFNFLQPSLEEEKAQLQSRINIINQQLEK